jgi:hypothetical protein
MRMNATTQMVVKSIFECVDSMAAKALREPGPKPLDAGTVLALFALIADAVRKFDKNFAEELTPHKSTAVALELSANGKAQS